MKSPTMICTAFREKYSLIPNLLWASSDKKRRKNMDNNPITVATQSDVGTECTIFIKCINNSSIF